MQWNSDDSLPNLAGDFEAVKSKVAKMQEIMV